MLNKQIYFLYTTQNIAHARFVVKNNVYVYFNYNNLYLEIHLYYIKIDGVYTRLDNNCFYNSL